MSIFNASDLMAFTLDISDRQIYNDIRSETDITEETEIIGDGTPEEYQEIEIPNDGHINIVVAADSTRDITFTAETGHTHITWLNVAITYANRDPYGSVGWSQVDCEAADGRWYPPSGGEPSACYFPDIGDQIKVNFITKGETTATARITNPFNYEITAESIAIYQYLAQEAIEGSRTVQTQTRTLTIRSTSLTSIRKYGRRVMNLVWPMGQTQAQAQSLIDAYKDRYSEPVSFASMSLEGSTDAKITQILAMDIDDKHQIIHPGVDMDQNFFINNLNIGLNREGTGILTATFGLEQVRPMEETTIFVLDTAELDATCVLG